MLVADVIVLDRGGSDAETGLDDAGAESHPAYSFQISEREIVDSQRDYIALGHWGAFKCVSDGDVKAYYCGSPSSGTRSVAIVDLVDKEEVRVQKYSVDKRLSD